MEDPKFKVGDFVYFINSYNPYNNLKKYKISQYSLVKITNIIINPGFKSGICCVIDTEEEFFENHFDQEWLVKCGPVMYYIIL